MIAYKSCVNKPSKLLIGPSYMLFSFIVLSLIWPLAIFNYTGQEFGLVHFQQNLHGRNVHIITSDKQFDCSR